MQEFIVLSIAGLALIYLAFKFIFKRESHDCDKCGSSGKQNIKH